MTSVKFAFFAFILAICCAVPLPPSLHSKYILEPVSDVIGTPFVPAFSNSTLGAHDKDELRAEDIKKLTEDLTSQDTASGKSTPYIQDAGAKDAEHLLVRQGPPDFTVIIDPPVHAEPTLHGNNHNNHDQEHCKCKTRCAKCRHTHHHVPRSAEIANEATTANRIPYSKKPREDPTHPPSTSEAKEYPLNWFGPRKITGPNGRQDYSYRNPSPERPPISLHPLAKHYRRRSLLPLHPETNNVGEDVFLPLQVPPDSTLPLGSNGAHAHEAIVLPQGTFQPFASDGALLDSREPSITKHELSSGGMAPIVKHYHESKRHSASASGFGSESWMDSHSPPPDANIPSDSVLSEIAAAAAAAATVALPEQRNHQASHQHTAATHHHPRPRRQSFRAPVPRSSSGNASASPSPSVLGIGH